MDKVLTGEMVWNMCEFCGNASIKERLKQWITIPIVIMFVIKEIIKEMRGKRDESF